jgi:YbbR domain-containing protein
VEDLGLKLLALAITFGLWFTVTGQRAPVERQLRGVQLDLRVPPAMEISNHPTAEVAIVVSGPADDLEQINAHSLVAVVDVTDRKPGQRVVELTPERVRIDLPRGIHVNGIEPNSVSLNLEPYAEREVEVEPRLEGKPANGYEVKSVVVTPGRVTVHGPAKYVSSLQKAPTETISVEGRRDSFEAPKTAIYISDQKVDVPGTVSVHVEIAERRNAKPKR